MKSTKFAKAIKAAVKRTKHQMRFLKTSTFNWNGRIIVTVNTDPSNIQMLPNLDFIKP